MNYCQLTYENRIEIKSYLNCGLNQSQIADKIGVNKSTISREINRNIGKKGYRPKQAHQIAQERKHNAKKNIRFTEFVKRRVIHYLKQQWSPEQISGYLKHHENIEISHETIYQFVWANKKNGGDLYKHLRHSNLLAY